MSSVLQPVLIAISIAYMLLIGIVYLVDRSMSRDVFSVLKLCAYFALIEAGIMLWFAVRLDRLYSLVLADVATEFVQDRYIVQAYSMSVLTFIAVAIGAALGSIPRYDLFMYLERKLVRTAATSKRGSKVRALGVFGVGVMLHIWVIQQSGGYAEIWADLHAVELATEGFGWHKAAYMFLITIGMCLAYPYLRRDGDYVLLALVIAVGLFCLGALAQRAPVGIALFVLLLTHHYTVSSLNRLLNTKVIGLAVVSIAFMFGAVQWRHGNIRIDEGRVVLEPRLDELEEHVIQRLGTTERQVVAIGYMDNNTYWGWGIYRSLITAYQRRSLNPDKPPVDTGVYITALSEGQSITPPLPARDMPESSWPDRYLAGFLSFGVAGLIGVAILSGMLFGLLYRLVLARQGGSAAVYLYGVIGFLGATPLSPLGIVKVGLAIVPTALIGWFYAITPRHILGEKRISVSRHEDDGGRASCVSAR